MPSAKLTDGKPDGFLPTPALVVSIVRLKPGISLRAICGALWPDLPWIPATPGADSATVRLRSWPGSKTRKSAATWLADLIGDLVLLRVLRYGHPVAEVDRLAGLTLHAVADVVAARVGHA